MGHSAGVQGRRQLTCASCDVGGTLTSAEGKTTAHKLILTSSRLLRDIDVQDNLKAAHSLNYRCRFPCLIKYFEDTGNRTRE